MIVNCSKPKISEYEFFRLLTSTIIKEKHNSIIKKIDLEKDLYHFYDNQNYHFLFEDVCKKESIDNCYVDLNSAFQTACAFGLIILIRDSGDMRAVINLTEEEAIKNISKFNPKEINAMANLCNELTNLEKKSPAIVLTKNKKVFTKHVF